MTFPSRPRNTRSSCATTAQARRREPDYARESGNRVFVDDDLEGYSSGVANVVPIPPPGFDEQTTEEKVRYVGAMWERIVQDQEKLPISDAQRAVLRERLAAHQANPRAARPWSEVRREIEQAVAQAIDASRRTKTCR
jgi:putative addiction module component (TIGR02574 family)